MPNSIVNPFSNVIARPLTLKIIEHTVGPDCIGIGFKKT